MPAVLDADLVARSREFVHGFWNGDVDRCLADTAADFTWIGPREGQYGQTASLFRDAGEGIARANPRVILLDETYEQTFATEDACVVEGQYVAYTSRGPAAPLASRQRLTLVWRTTADGLRLAHLHVSNPLRPGRPDEGGPPRGDGTAQDASRYLTAISSRQGYRTSHALRDVRGTTHMVRLFDVVYLEAHRQSTTVHCLSRTFRVRAGVAGLASDLAGEDGSALVCVHRSFYVNALYVESVGADSLTLSDGTTVPVSVRRHTEVCGEIARIRTAEE